MFIRINQLILPLDYTEEDILLESARLLGCSQDILSDVHIVRRSLDARSRRGKPVFVLALTLKTKNRSTIKKSGNKDIEILSDELLTPCLHLRSAPAPTYRPLVVGAGPAGLMAALILAEAGLAPILIERGAPAEHRARQVNAFWQKNILDKESNVLYGEGGAGLFSDGKLTARSKDHRRVRFFLEKMVECGASADILIDVNPHLGTDIMMNIVPALRRLIIKAGGEVRFHTRLESIEIEQGVLRGVHTSHNFIETPACILATGHSARDIYQMLAQKKIALMSKAFAVGVRLELPQARINHAQWGSWAGHPKLGAATFRLTFRPTDTLRACYTFCMCPGGRVIACSSSDALLTTNGMSFSHRAEQFANAAFLAPVTPEDFSGYGKSGESALKGCEFQSTIEQKAFIAGGGDYALPASPLKDFLTAAIPRQLPQERSCPHSRPADIHAILPKFISRTLAVAIPQMLKALNGVRLEEVLLYAAETRSSSPVRIIRDKDGQSPGVRGLFPCGEGAGYAGGIVSSAVDGIRAAEALLCLLYDNYNNHSHQSSEEKICQTAQV